MDRKFGFYTFSDQIKATKFWGNSLGFILLLSFIGASFLFFAQGNKGFLVGDEGYLWYGVQRVMHGEVPIRDFCAYDPGRYYFSAGLMEIMHNDGLLALRATQSIIQFFTVILSLWLVASQGKIPGKLFLFLIAVIFFVWMIPRHKFYDICISIIYIFLLYNLLKSPSRRQYILTGIVVGLIAFFGRNHALYGFLAGTTCMVWLRVIERKGLPLLQAAAWYLLGLVVGVLPLLAMMQIPGFLNAFWESIITIFARKTTNIALPLPWPWTVDFQSLSFDATLRRFLFSLYFIGSILYGVAILVYCFLRRRKDEQTQEVLVVTAILSLIYSHYVFSRADIEHLTHSIFPMLIGLSIFISTQYFYKKWIPIVLLCTTSFFVACIYHPYWQYMVSANWVTTIMDGDKIIISPRKAHQWQMIQSLANKYTPHGESFLAIPFWTGAYPALSRRSPTWDIYALWPRSAAFQRQEIKRIQRADPRFVFLDNYCLDGDGELCFRKTNPLIYQYIVTHFRQIPSDLSPDYLIFIAQNICPQQQGVPSPPQ